MISTQSQKKGVGRCAVVLFLWVLSVTSSRSQMAPPRQRVANDVVMLSLEAINSHTELRQQIREGLIGDSAAEHSVEKRLLEIQMNIVREAARFGPVLLLAPDQATKAAAYQRCGEFKICELFRSDRVRMAVVAHDGVWIRDFGPQIEAIGETASVVHWRYFDIRTEEGKREKLQELEAMRLRLLEAREREEQPDALTQESTPEARQAAASIIDDKLYLLRQYSEILNAASPQRSNDESSAYDIADAVLAAPDFPYKVSKLALDGGNLFRLEDGRCLTTRMLLSRNKEQDLNVGEELKKTGGCKEVTYLDPLPGEVIEHVDMFVLPAGGKRVLIASYDLSSPFASEYWNALSPAERDLATNAALAMAEDAERLRKLGYEVVSVPSPFPRIPANGHSYYPSVLNALVRTATDGSKLVIVPSFQEYETDVQTAALKQISAAFGAHTEVVPIEATEAAQAQGAIHCLTLSAPLRLSIFGDSEATVRRTATLAQKDRLDRSAGEQIAAQIPVDGLRGLWAILEKGAAPEAIAVNLYPQRVYFGEKEFQKGMFEKVESQGKYTVERKEADTWSIQFVFANQDVVPAAAQWMSKDEVKLIFADGSNPLWLRRVSAAKASPFRQDVPGSGRGAGIPGNEKKKDGDPAPSLQPVQP